MNIERPNKFFFIERLQAIKGLSILCKFNYNTIIIKFTSTHQKLIQLSIKVDSDIIQHHIDINKSHRE